MKAIIFDLDGVLISTDEQHYLAWKEISDKLGIPFDREVNNRFRGVSRAACMDLLEELSGRHYSAEEKEKYATEKNKRYRDLLAELSPENLNSEIRQTLDKLRALNLKLAVGSSSRNAKFILGKIGLGNYFDAISDGNNITQSKPDPEVFRKAAEFLSVDLDSCIVVEDAVSGVQAGKAAGMLTIAIGDAASKGLGDYNIASFSEIFDIVSALL